MGQRVLGPLGPFPSREVALVIYPHFRVGHGSGISGGVMVEVYGERKTEDGFD